MIDLHMHTTCSDGQFSPEETMRMAHEAGVTVAAVTDHDTASGISRARAAAEQYGMTFFSGIEISVQGEKELHILGYGIQPENAALQEFCKRHAADRKERCGKILEYLHRHGVQITLDGTGDLFRRFEKLRNELEEMGMFSPEYKTPIPKYAKTVGIVTASTGAAIRDIINISGRRNPYVQLVLCPALVQGAGAAPSIVRAIQTLDALHLDVLIVGRGGGSIEDLWAFNEESVARAIFACRTPVISAVGHETDVTIADYVADLRAPTRRRQNWRFLITTCLSSSALRRHSR